MSTLRSTTTPGARVFLDGPDRYTRPPGLLYEGANPRLLDQLSTLFARHEGEIAQLDVAMFLFSSPRLARQLVALSRTGSLIRVFTTPLDGYHRRSLPVEDRAERWSKYEVAKRILPYFSTADGIELNIFSHVFVRSDRYRRFERGSLPYSLHTKTMRLTLRDGREIVVLSSSNLSAVDETKDECLVVTDPGPPDPAASDFFKALTECSFPLGEEVDIYDYQVTARQARPDAGPHLFTGPFFEDSNTKALALVRATVATAKRRLIVAAEHIAAGDFSVLRSQTRSGGEGELTVAGPLEPLLSGSIHPERVRLLSQTSSQPTHGGRTPGNTRAFAEFEARFRALGVGEHHVVPSNHMKFIVADDVVLFASSNLTPTTFAYLPSVKLTLGQGSSARYFRCVHSEVGHWMRVEDALVADILEERVTEVAARPSSRRIA